ncbi:ABC transporter ATP-binding protein [Jidongwangia harbinensis]|uniref:ABC transporter ATP-binding protein n=1 Tax=Jidongwangia harbinensis TaxID=2878561 RepID=UPI001CD9C453|nr:ABC transporter ATP-binding protein [Jidongwangia harbinensis]MCA2214114.1 ABC transporter ATP-binding protein/permease [Jidongwangia harbinensis]
MRTPAGPVRSLTQLCRTVRAAVVLLHRADRRRCALVATLHLLSAGLLVAQVLAGRAALHGVLAADQGESGVRDVVLPLAVLAACGAAASLCTPLLALHHRLLGEQAQRTAYDQILDVTSTVDLERFDDPAFFDHLQRVQTHAVERPLQLAHNVMQLAGGTAAIAGLTLALAALHPLLVPLLAVTGVPLLLVSRHSGWAEFRFAVSQSTTARLRLHLRAVLLGRAEAPEVRAFALQAPFRARYDELCDRYLGDLHALVRRRQRQAALAGLINAGVATATMLVLLLALVHDRIALADAGAAMLAVRLLATRIDATFGALTALFENAHFLTDLHRFSALAPAAGRPPQAAAPPGRLAVLQAHHLGYRYPGAPRPALDGVHLTLRRGETIGLVGENGSGKSTLAMLLAGLLTPAAGTVTWNGTDLACYDPEALRRRIAVVFPDAVRYAMSAHDNIALGHHSDRADVIRSARAAGADTVVGRLPDGYDTILSSEYAGGRDLSDGQWQRITLARAFHRDAELIILDEPATALDPRAEHDLFASVRTLFADRTVVVISHRLANVRAADRIIVLAGGRVAEEGDHDTLMAAGGPYAALFTLQAQGYGVAVSEHP